MNLNKDMFDRLNIYGTFNRCLYQALVIRPLVTEELTPELLVKVDDACKKYKINSLCALNLIALEKHRFNFSKLNQEEYNFTDSFIKRANSTYNMCDLKYEFYRLHPDLECLSTSMDEIDIICKKTGTITSITIENISNYQMYVISSMNFTISKFSKSKARLMNMTKNLIKWDIDNSTIFSLIPNPEYTPAEVISYVNETNKLIGKIFYNGICCK